MSKTEVGDVAAGAACRSLLARRKIELQTAGLFVEQRFKFYLQIVPLPPFGPFDGFAIDAPGTSVVSILFKCLSFGN
jgi:hypothetical protein